MKKKLVLMLLSATMVLGTLTGCGDKKVEEIPMEESVSAEVAGENAGVAGTESTAETVAETTEDFVEEVANETPSLVVSKESNNSNQFTGSSSSTTSDEDVEYEVDSDYSLANVAYLVDDLAKSKGAKANTVVSETSLNMALSMLLGGSVKDTSSYSDLITYLSKSNFSDDYDSIMIKNRMLIDQYAELRHVDLKLANSVWSHTDRVFSQPYIDLITSKFDGKISSIDFNSKTTPEVINNWVSDATKGTIYELIPDEKALAGEKAVLINALYFLGDWEEAFTKKQCKQGVEFKNAAGEVDFVTMMTGTTDWCYENDNTYAFAKPYDDESIVFIGILPKEEGNFNLSDLDLDSLLEGTTYDYDVTYHMPKFRIEDSNVLKNSLESIGLTSIFAPNNTDFLGMCEKAMTVSNIRQKTYIDVTEKGTEASAATSVEMTDGAVADEEVKEQLDINLNRPFAFMIYDTSNHECLFIGKINKLWDYK